MEIKTAVLGEVSTNCYMLSGGDYAVVIDPDEFNGAVRTFAEQNRDKKTKIILLTHCHFDHIGGVVALKKFWSAPVFIGENEGESLKNPLINLSARFCSEPVSITADKLLKNGEIIDLGEDYLKVVFTPGHTSGSVCYLGKDVLFSGDTLFRLTAGRYDFPTADREALLNSLRILKNLEGDYRVLSGHGPQTTLEIERTNNRYMRKL